MHTQNTSVTLDEAITRLEDLLDFHTAAPNKRPDACGLYDIVRSFCKTGTDKAGHPTYATAYRVCVHVPATWMADRNPWITCVSEDLVEALDEASDRIYAAAPVSA